VVLRPHSGDADAIAKETGAFVNPDPRYLQSTGFVLDPAGRVVVSVYSSGGIGRLVPADVLGLVRYLREYGYLPGPGGGAWLCNTLVRSLFHAAVVPSGFRTKVQPQRWITT
jgi:hypothetical protein